MTDMIRATGLVKRYKDVDALAGLDLAVPEGKVLGLLGPNGAGKTTAVRILATLLKADAGHAEVAGIDVAKDPDGVRARIGLSGQYAAVDEHLTGYENLEMVGRLYGMPKSRAAKRARDLLERFDLADAGDRPSKTYSGGMRRRLDLAGALVAEPPVLILDEPTTGLDVRSRQQMWGVIRDLVSSGATLLLTTQYLEEADLLADDIVVIDHGRAIARGTADELKTQTGGERIEVLLTDPARREDATRILAEVAVGDVQTGDNDRELTAPVKGGVPQLRSVLEQLESAGIDVLDVGLRRPTLDDVFLSLTGRAAEDADAPDEEVAP
ncbi:ATP-binding cassette domain-containing protein [Aeromicrobium chenweiae]|uniref:Daunorubicin/doxorubicin resistance ABC transporter ATP-binding protein DrrA n=1 Tax=Aeromicrobium chenweiae TaxID=2079793 RepID=A0A2S0WL35_9ACTN|nr:ATP-binding cassette domain-containing protein [Aeromicrobium chenweiae]AWB92007.1 daunorubicin/doxorubicin resistance ABC transporter ATP-binding protein DrrA [Aeromicrobium chenweiae]TGN32858.1 ATP-binding cassette domain-containing protein [Aeromicrobium chenweiae]